MNMSASADVLAMAKVEVDLTSIPEGKNVSHWKETREGRRGKDKALLTRSRSSSSGEESPFSSDTEPRTRSTRRTRSTFLHYEIPRLTMTESSNPSGWSCWVRLFSTFSPLSQLPPSTLFSSQHALMAGGPDERMKGREVSRILQVLI